MGYLLINNKTYLNSFITIQNSDRQLTGKSHEP